jgi:hypothetical protein
LCWRGMLSTHIPCATLLTCACVLACCVCRCSAKKIARQMALIAFDLFAQLPHDELLNMRYTPLLFFTITLCIPDVCGGACACAVVRVCVRVCVRVREDGSTNRTRVRTCDSWWIFSTWWRATWPRPS